MKMLYPSIVYSIYSFKNEIQGELYNNIVYYETALVLQTEY
jgi:hypothetical protein